MIVPDSARAAPYVRGGRGPAGLDCLGIVLMISKALGNPIDDPWERLLEQWNETSTLDTAATGFPATWARVDDLDLRDGDVWLWTLGGHPGCGIVFQGRVWTAMPHCGVVSLSSDRAPQPEQVWRP